MAIEIVRPGITSAEIKYTAECYRCKCVVRFTGADGRVTSDQRDGDFINVTCPTCGTTISTALISPTEHLRREANRNVDPY